MMSRRSRKKVVVESSDEEVEINTVTPKIKNYQEDSTEEQQSDEEQVDDIEDEDDEDSTTKKHSSASKKKGRVKAFDSDEEKPKRGPGRPPNKPRQDTIPRKGISKAPTFPNSCVEMMYTHPTYIKKIMDFFQNIRSTNAHITFETDHVIFFSNDEKAENNVQRLYVRINASRLNHYYCLTPTTICVPVQELSKTLKKIDKNYISMLIMLRNDAKYRCIEMTLENVLGVEELYNIETVGLTAPLSPQILQEFQDETHTVHFTIPSQTLKKIVVDIHSMSKQMSFSQPDAESPVVLEYSTSNRKTKCKYSFKNLDKMDFVSTLGDDTLRVDVQVDNLVPLIKQCISQNTQIFIDENKKLLLKAILDEGTIEFKMMTNIIDQRTQAIEPIIIRKTNTKKIKM